MQAHFLSLPVRCSLTAYPWSLCQVKWVWEGEACLFRVCTVWRWKSCYVLRVCPHFFALDPLLPLTLIFPTFFSFCRELWIPTSKETYNETWLMFNRPATAGVQPNQPSLWLNSHRGWVSEALGSPPVPLGVTCIALLPEDTHPTVYNCRHHSRHAPPSPHLEDPFRGKWAMAQHSNTQLFPALKCPSSKMQGVKQRRDNESLTHRDISPPQASENKWKATPVCFTAWPDTGWWMACLSYAQPSQPFVFILFPLHDNNIMKSNT